jgi:hypothetical protein
VRYIQAQPFAHKHWRPLNFIVQPDPPKNAGQTRLEDDVTNNPAQEANSRPAVRKKDNPTNDEGTRKIGDKVGTFPAQTFFFLGFSHAVAS